MGSASSDSNNIVINAVRSNNKTLLQDILSKDDGKAVMNELDSNGTGVIHMIAKDGHYKYPPNDIPKLLIDSGLDVNKVDAKGNTALQISLLSGWQKIAILLLDNGADKSVVTDSIKSRITCPDCKKVVKDYQL